MINKILTKIETPIIEGELDYSPLYKQVHDKGIPVDSSNFDFTKVSSDSLPAVDQEVQFNVSKELSDEAPQADSQILDVLKPLTDTEDVSDGVTTIGVGLNTIDFVNEAEFVAVDTTKPLTDIQVPVDSSELTTTKPVETDTFDVSDSFDRTVDFLRDFEDQIQIVDTFVGYTFEDEEIDSIIVLPVGVEDDPEVTTSKIVDDEIQYIDDTSNLETTKQLTETLVATDTFSRTFNAYKYFNESQVPSDTGVILIPDYVDLTYFSEEYVGDIIRTF